MNMEGILTEQEGQFFILSEVSSAVLSDLPVKIPRAASTMITMATTIIAQTTVTRTENRRITC
jgi:hypothetical protein